MKKADEEITRGAVAARRGSVIAAAGCGKTEQIALATKLSSGRRLILTHTHAGVDALRERLAKLDVPPQRFRIDTIAGWSLRYASSFPRSSGLANFDPRAAGWSEVYQATNTLLLSGAVGKILAQSYEGVFVDEYQDCDSTQHEIVSSLAEVLPVCVFGDPLQGIFEFSGTPVDWHADVETRFPQLGELTYPHRWLKVGNTDMADWLSEVRQRLLLNGTISDLSRPPCVTVTRVGSASDKRTAAIEKAKAIQDAARNAHKTAGAKRVVIIGDEVSLGQRENLAMKLSRLGFSNIEAVDCKPLFRVAEKLDAASSGVSRLAHLLSFSDKCMTGLGVKELTKAVTSSQAGGKLGRARYGRALSAAVGVVVENSDAAAGRLLQELRDLPQTRLYCRERYSALQRAIDRKSQTGISLREAVWDVQNQGRHAGRKVGRRSVGSTLLVKGLEFERTVLVHSQTMSSKDLYVAVTRGIDGLEIVSG